MLGQWRGQITISEAVAEMFEHSVRALFTMSSWMCDGLKRWRACVCHYTVVKVSTYLCVVGFVSKTTSSSSSLQSDRERPTADLLGLSGNP